MTRRRNARSRPDAADWLALLLGLAALALRLYDLGGPSAAFYDELTTLGKSLAPSFGDALAAMRWQYPPYIDFQPPLYVLLTHAFLALGHTDFIARLPAALSGAASVPLLYLIGRRLGGRGLGLFVAAALAVNLYHIDASQQTRLYAFFGCMSLAAIWSCLRATAAGTIRQGAVDWALYALFLTVTLYTSYLGVLTGLICAGLVLLTLAWPKGPDARIGPSLRISKCGLFAGCLLANALAAAAFLPWLASTAEMRRFLLVRATPLRPPLTQALAETFTAFSSHYAAFIGMRESCWLLAAPVVAGALAGLAVRRRRMAAAAAILWFAACFAPVWLRANATHHFQVRYLLPCLFALLLLAAMLPVALLDACSRIKLLETNRAWRAVRLALPIALGLSLALPNLPVYPFFYRRDDSRLKTLAAFLRERSGPGVALAFLGGNPPWSPLYFETFKKWYLPDTFAFPLPGKDRSYRQCLVVIPDGEGAPKPPRNAALIGRLARTSIYRLPLVNASPVLATPESDGGMEFEADLRLPAAFAQISESANVRLDLNGLVPADRGEPGMVAYVLAPLPGQKIALERLELDAQIDGYPGVAPTGRMSVLVGNAPDALRPYVSGMPPEFGGALHVRITLDPGPRRESVRLNRLAIRARISGRPEPGASPAKEAQARLAANTEIAPDAPRSLYPGRRPLVAVTGMPHPAETVAVIGDAAYADPLLSPDAGRVGAGAPLTLHNPGQSLLILDSWKIVGPLVGPGFTLGGESFSIPLTASGAGVARLRAAGRGTLDLTPLFTEEAYDPAQADAVERMARLKSEPALSCPDGEPCSITYALVTGYPAERLRLTWFPRVFADPAGKNHARVEYGFDGGAFHLLDAFESSGSGRWEGLGVGRTASIDLGGKTGVLRLRFELSGDAAQLWSSLETPLRATVNLNTMTLPRFSLPTGETTLTSDCPDPPGVVVRPNP